MNDCVGSVTCGIVMVLPASSYAGTTHVGPVLSVIFMISLTVLAVRIWFRVVVPLALVTKPDQLPVGIQRPILLDAWRAGDSGLRAVQHATLHFGQAIERIVLVILIKACRDGRGTDDIGLPEAVRVLIVAVFVAVDVDWRSSDIVLPALVDDPSEEVDAGEDARRSAPEIEPDAWLGVGDPDYSAGPR